MAVKTRSQLLADNAALFVTNTTGNITPPLEKAFNDDTLDSVALIPVVIAANETALNDQSYVVVANATFTDPSPVEGKGFSVLVRNGTATIGGTAYSVAGTIIIRIFHSGGWANFTPENVANKATGFGTVNNTLYPSVQATRTEIRAGITQIATAPTVNDDIDLGYIVGSRVIAQDTRVEWLCLDNTDGAAVWQAQSGIWTPTSTLSSEVSNIGTIATLFSVSGNICSFSIMFAIDFAANTGFGNENPFINFTPPIPSSFIGRSDVIGVSNMDVPFSGVQFLTNGGLVAEDDGVGNLLIQFLFVTQIGFVGHNGAVISGTGQYIIQ